ncbi:MAG: hypothetical protein ACTSPY_04950 [Candidatus Helarchaeota archaeon]
MSDPTKSPEKWISELNKSILLLSQNGISISEVVNLLQKNYNSKQTCWAAISRTCKNLANKKLLEVIKRNKRVVHIQTSLLGKKLIYEICDELEILSNTPKIKMYREISTKIKHKINYSSNSENLIDNDEIRKLILEILAKYGELTLHGLSYCIDIPEILLDKILNNMIDSSLILRVKDNDRDDINKFQINWKYLFLPIKKIQ